MLGIRNRRKIVVRALAVVGGGAVFLFVNLLGLALTIGVPDVIAGIEEPAMVRMLGSHPTRAMLTTWLEVLHANWHRGATYSEGEAYSSFFALDPCAVRCDTALQVAFGHRWWLCEVTGDVVTVTFDRDMRAASWRIVSGADGC